MTSQGIVLCWKRLQVVIFDYSGIGSSNGTLPVKIADMAQDVNDIASHLNTVLTNEHMRTLSDISKIGLGSPHEIIEASQESLFGRGSGLIEIKHPVA